MNGNNIITKMGDKIKKQPHVITNRKTVLDPINHLKTIPPNTKPGTGLNVSKLVAESVEKQKRKVDQYDRRDEIKAREAALNERPGSVPVDLKRKGNQTEDEDEEEMKNNKGKKKNRPPRRKIAKKNLFRRYFGLCLGTETVVLRSRYAKEVVELLQLQPWHLKKIKTKFIRMDVDGSGNISAEEFLLAMGQVRSPFTDRLFELIGNCYIFFYFFILFLDQILD